MNKIAKISLIVIGTLLALIIVLTRIERINPIGLGLHDKVNHGLFSDIAIDGFDPIAYYNEGQAIKGNESFTYAWNESTWYFKTEANRDLFSSSPEKYAPQYGGYCGFAVSTGFTAKTNPEFFEIIDGKLYLFSAEDVKTEWKKDLSNNLNSCDKNWK